MDLHNPNIVGTMTGNVPGGGGLFTEDADQNIVGGSGAGAALVGSSALNNFLGGNSAGALITEGDANIAIGTDSLNANLVGSNNVAIGQDALGTAITSSNIGIGTLAGRNIGGTGANSIAIGHGALGDPQGGSTGTNNIVLGVDAMTSGVMGSAEWNFIVHATTTAMTNADSNIIIGELAAEQITTGGFNVFLGEGAGAAITTGSSNIAIGLDALENVSGSPATGSFNIAIGRDSLSAVGITNATRNIAIGRQIGALVTSANRNIIMGDVAGAKLTTGAYNLILGDAAGPTTNTSNKLFINQAESDTPLIGGDFSTGAFELSGTIRLTERADHIGTPAATFGELWLRSDSPNTLIFTDDAGTDHDLTADFDTSTPNEWTGQQNFNEAAIDSTSNAIAWDLNIEQTAVHTMTENTTISAPTNMKAGSSYALRIVQAAGVYTLAFNAVFKWGAETAPAAPAANGDVVILSFYSDGTSMYGVEFTREEA